MQWLRTVVSHSSLTASNRAPLDISPRPPGRGRWRAFSRRFIPLRTMAAAIKGMVSKNKIRYKEDGFDLDLSYISRNIIAMGFPAEKNLERWYRNHIDDVVHFFETKHKDRYQIYNLCAESKRRYDIKKFNSRVIEKYSFQDHNPPPFEFLKPFCEDVHQWLSQDTDNVIAIHCKAGKGRTGVMICAYLIHSGQLKISDSGEPVKISGAEKALEYYGRHRTHDKKGVTIPSQRRYVYYFEELVKHGLEYQSTPLKLCSISMNTIPIFNGGAFTLLCEISQLPKFKLKSYEIEVKKGMKSPLHYALPDELICRGDIKLEFFIKTKIKKEKIFQFCFNTFFVKPSDDTECSGFACFGDKKCLTNHSNHSNDSSETPITNVYSNEQINSNANSNSNSNRKCSERKSSGKELTLVLPKDQLDKAYKDRNNRMFTQDFKVKLTFTKPIHSYSRSPVINKAENRIDSSLAESGSTDNDSEADTDEDDEDYD